MVKREAQANQPADHTQKRCSCRSCGQPWRSGARVTGAGFGQVTASTTWDTARIAHPDRLRWVAVRAPKLAVRWDIDRHRATVVKEMQAGMLPSSNLKCASSVARKAMLPTSEWPSKRRSRPGLNLDDETEPVGAGTVDLHADAIGGDGGEGEGTPDQVVAGDGAARHGCPD